VISAGFRKRLFLCAAVLSLSVTAAFSAPPESGNDVVTFSLRTKDGLVVLNAGETEVKEWKKLLKEAPSAPLTNIELFRWLTGRGAHADSIRLYTASPESVRIGAHPLAWEKTTVGAAVREGLIPDIKGRDIFEAYMMIRTSGEQFYMLEQAGGTEEESMPELGKSIFIMSSSSGNGFEGIYVDGVNYSSGSNGYNIVAFDTDGSIISPVGSFDFFSDPDAGGKMAVFLNDKPPGTYIAVSVRYGPGVYLTSDAVEALHGYGSRIYPDPQILSSHAMFGRKGWREGAAMEASEVNLGSAIFIYDKNIYVGVSKLDDLSVGQGGRIAAITGTGENDTLYMLK
jgi:hypothetical protein